MALPGRRALVCFIAKELTFVGRSERESLTHSGLSVFARDNPPVWNDLFVVRGQLLVTQQPSPGHGRSMEQRGFQAQLTDGQCGLRTGTPDKAA